MANSLLPLFLLHFCLLHTTRADPGACTTLLVGRNATIDGSVFVTHSMDEANNDFRLIHVPAKNHTLPAQRPVYPDYENYPRVVSADIAPDYAPVGNQTVSTPLGTIPQVAHTYAFLDLSYGAVNEHQLAIGESTCSAVTVGLPNNVPGGQAMFWVGELSHLAMERCQTARCAVQLMGELAEKYGFYGAGEREGGGETLTVADPKEAWVFHVLAGADDEGGNAIWVAKRLPDNQMTVVSNMFTIRAVNLTDSDNYYGRKEMHAIALKQGWWDGITDFDFTAAFSIGEYSHEYYSGRRMWRALSLVAPSLKLDPTVGSPLNASGLGPNQEFYPWGVVPDTPVQLQTLQAIHRDHYENTSFDLTQGLAAGPFSSPNRWGGASHEHAIVGGAWERPISVYRVNYNHITQLRSWLPDEVGPCLWFGPHVPHGTVYNPIYIGAQMVPLTYSSGNMAQYDSTIAWWRHAVVSNWAQLKWSYMIEDIRKEQTALAEGFVAAQKLVEVQAVALIQRNRMKEARTLLRGHVQTSADLTATTWAALTNTLITKYKDGFVDQTPGKISAVGTPVGYPSWWLHAVGFDKFPKMSPMVCGSGGSGSGGEGGSGGGGQANQELVELRRKVLLLENEIEQLKKSGVVGGGAVAQ